MNINVKQYSSALDVFVSQTTNVYENDQDALFALDPTGGGKNIPVGTTYLQNNSLLFDTNPNSNASFLLLERAVLGATVVTGTTTPGLNGNSLFVIGNTFLVYATQAGSSTAAATSYTVTLTGTSVASFINAVGAANIPYVSASVNSAGNIVFTHSQGGTIALDNTTGTLFSAGNFTAGSKTVTSGDTINVTYTLSASG
jgi:hypothetical protein